MGIFDHSDNGSDSSSQPTNYTCPTPSVEDPTQSPILRNLSFHQLISIISGACMIISCLVFFHLIFRHGTHYSLPKKQRQIIRIIFMIPVFSFISFLSVIWYSGVSYLNPIEDVYEAVALASFFLFLCALVQEDDVERQAYFQTSGLTQNYISAAIGTFQFPPIMILVLIFTEITQATGSYCATSNNVHFAHIWLTIVTAASTIIAISSILRFYRIVKPTINHCKPLPKLLGFKAIVFLNFLQKMIFSFLTSSNKLVPTSHITFQDLSIGLPNLILSVEMVIFAIAFLYIYSTREYMFQHAASAASAVPLYQGGFMGMRAYGDAMNFIDILQRITSVPGLLMRKRGREEDRGENWKVWVTGVHSQGTEVTPEDRGYTEYPAQTHLLQQNHGHA